MREWVEAGVVGDVRRECGRGSLLERGRAKPKRKPAAGENFEI